MSSLTLLQSSSLLPRCLLASYSTGGKIKSEVATGVNAEVPATEVNAKQGRRFDWTPAVCSVQFVPLRVWMIRIFFRFTYYTPLVPLQSESNRVYGQISGLFNLDVSAGAMPLPL